MSSSALSRRLALRWGAVTLGSAAVGSAALGSVALSACSRGSANESSSEISPFDDEVRAAEQARFHSGRTVERNLTAAPARVSLGAREVDTWSYGAEAVGPELRISKGDRLNVLLQNDLPTETSVHWHGITIRNDMDGVPPVTQERIQPGAEFTYDFVAPDHGTYWYHSHSGLQADRGLFGALVVEDPNDRTGADEDVVIVIDDWLDGLGTTPDAVLRALSPDVQGGHHGHGGAPPEVDDAEIDSAAELLASGHGNSEALGGMATHITYPLHLINGRPVEDPFVVSATAGTRLRLRVINAGAETPYRFSVAGHEMTVVSADGQDVAYTAGDEILIAPAQRYDVLVTVQSGSWPIAAKVEGKSGGVACLLRTPDSVAVVDLTSPAVLSGSGGRLVLESELRPSGALEQRAPDRAYSVDLIQAGDRYLWGMAGADAGRLRMKQGERIRIVMNNDTDMWHPMHTHGHTFSVPSYGGLRRDTVIVLPRTQMAIDFDADNPGRWMFHCHNAYHFEAGMTADLHYVR
ncbi:multicopper oxidase family protein [Rhodococcus qingshengii]|uniref:multicopper oxidase family protein n=1 Tax=Rhodococcus TaxID=1827 RepID=UPI001BA9E673|nr:multicopper oxidase family protein [Rhodococcus qingshengii]MBS3692008.1 multicopper oxidase family protein [Rhodococcus qingshengii]